MPGKREEARELSTFLATYHVLPSWKKELTYRDDFGLLLNAERVNMREAIAHAHGHAAATSPEDLPRLFADALANDAAEVDELEYRINSARREARARSRDRRGGLGG